MDPSSATPSRLADPVRLRAQLGVGVLFAASGASGLMLEIVWSRMLVWLLGATTWSVMTILVAFMGGLGLGGILWGRWSGRSSRPLRLFALMELAIGLYSLAVPILFEWLGHVFVMATQMVGDSPGIVVAIRVIAAVAALAPPTLLMGGTLPVLTRFAARRGAEPGRAAGLLYAANTAGAVAGCSVTGCLLIFRLGVIESNLVAALIDLGVGIAALSLDRWEADSPVDDRPPGNTRIAPAAAWGRCLSPRSRGSAGWRTNSSGLAACWRP